MRITRGKKIAATLVAASMGQTLGGCLPEDFFALTGRQVSLAIADSILSTVFNTVFPELPPLADGAGDAADGDAGADGGG